jgi:hypothetical protein
MRGMRRVLGSVAVVALLGAMAALPTWSAFSGTTADAGNSFQAGTVTLTDDDSTSAMMTLGGMRPGDGDSACIMVTYTGSLPASVRLLGTTTGSGLAPFLDLKVTRGTKPAGTFDSCTGFTADATDYAGQGAGVMFNGTLDSYPDSYAAGVLDPRPAAVKMWGTGEAHTYRFDVTLRDDNGAQGLTATQTFTWEARSLGGGYAGEVMADRPMSYWRLGETAGPTARDSMGTDNGTYQSSPVYGRTGAFTTDDGAVGVDDTSDHVTIPDSVRNSTTAAVTAEGWFKFDVLPNTGDTYSYMGLVTKQFSYYLRVDLSGTSPRARMYVFNTGVNCAGAPAYATSTTEIQTGVWYHLAGTYDGSNVRVYVNGTLEGTASRTSAICDTAAPVQLLTTGTHFRGSASDVALYDTALSGSRIAAHAAAG